MAMEGSAAVLSDRSAERPMSDDTSMLPLAWHRGEAVYGPIALTAKRLTRNRRLDCFYQEPANYDT